MTVNIINTGSEDFMFGVDMVRRYQRIKEQTSAPAEHPLATRLRSAVAKHNSRHRGSWSSYLISTPIAFVNTFSGSSNYAHATLFGAQPGTVYTGTSLAASVLQGTR